MATIGDQKHATVDASVTTKPNDISAAPALLEKINAGVEALQSADEVDGTRLGLLANVNKLVHALETPRETMIKHTWAQLPVFACLLFSIDCGLFRLMAKNGDGPQKTAPLAAELGVEEALLRRVLRHLSAMGYLIETGVDEHELTNYSKAMSLPSMAAGYYCQMTGLGGGMIKFQNFARENGWKTPTDGAKTATMYAEKTDLPTFAWFESLGYSSYFADSMSIYAQGRPSWAHPTFYPAKERLITGADTSSESIFMVDVGGSQGHDMVEFHQFYPQAPGKLVVQDLPDVIRLADKKDSIITPMEYDFFTEQPIKGARAYFMHSVLHDWSDEKCVQILAQVKTAMKPGYSKLLINENLIPAKGAHWEASALDIIMMVNFSSRERTESDWRDLLEEKAGLKIIEIWEGRNGAQSLIECELP